MKLDIVPFIESLRKTFSEMVGELPVIFEPVHGDDAQIMADISASIGIIGTEKYTVVLDIPDEIAAKLVTEIIGSSITIDYQIIADTVGELLNMITGNAQKFCDEKYDFSLPQVILGKNHQIQILNGMRYQKVDLILFKTKIRFFLISTN